MPPTKLIRRPTWASLPGFSMPGDASVMRATVALALKHGVAVGARLAFQNLQGFGRRELRASPREVEDLPTLPGSSTRESAGSS